MNKILIVRRGFHKYHGLTICVDKFPAPVIIKHVHKWHYVPRRRNSTRYDKINTIGVQEPFPEGLVTLISPFSPHYLIVMEESCFINGATIDKNPVIWIKMPDKITAPVVKVEHISCESAVLNKSCGP